MILFGKKITSTDDPLVKVPVEKIYYALRNPKSETTAHIRQLRIVRNIDKKRYSLLKRQLPYLVCGIFSPPFRRSENFAYIEYFILDIDHISDKNISLSDLRSRVEKDSRVVLSFVSPSEDGLKIMFRLSEKCYDRGMFTLFYKIFARQFAPQYGIEQVIDAQTCDVTRACFVSIDPEAYYNPQAETVDIKHFLPNDDVSSLFDLKRKIEHEEKEEQAKTTAVAEPEPKTDVDAEVISNIKAILNPNSVRKKEKQVFVPEQLNEIIAELQSFIEDTGITVTEIINISYGKKIRMRLRMRQAEVNLFYGKRGFSAVKSPRTGTDDELNEMMLQLIMAFINTRLQT